MCTFELVDRIIIITFQEITGTIVLVYYESYICIERYACIPYMVNDAIPTISYICWQ